MFGWDHCETGRQLIANWKLPSDFDAVVLGASLRQADGWRLGNGGIDQDKLQDGGRGGISGVPRMRDDAISELLDGVPARERRLFCPESRNPGLRS